MNTEIKVSIPISFELLKKIDNVAKAQHENAVELIERVLEDYTKLMRQKRDQREIEILNKIAEEQGEEILENLEYQVDIWNEENFTELKNPPKQNPGDFAFMLLPVAVSLFCRIIKLLSGCQFIPIETA